MQEKPAKIRMQLDGSRLLGFDQAPVRGSERAGSRVRLASLGTKMGAKPGVKN